MVQNARIVKTEHPEKAVEAVEAEIPTMLNQQGHEIDKLNETLHDLRNKLEPVLTDDPPGEDVQTEPANSDIGTQLARNNQKITAIQKDMKNILELLAL